MEFRDLESFLAVIREGTISGAAHALHIAQPSLSRQMRGLEEKVGRPLFIRGNRQIMLTEEGLILQKRANEILQLINKTESEISHAGEELAGDIYIGAAETNAVHYLTQAAAALHLSSPKVRFHIVSGDTTDTALQLEHGLIDFALIYTIVDTKKYNYIRLPVSDHIVALMKKEHPLAKRKSVSFKKDLLKEPLIISRLAIGSSLNGSEISSLNIVGTYNLAYNASHMVEDGLGIALCFDSIVKINSQSRMCMVPISDMSSTVNPVIIWKKYQTMSQVANSFITELEKIECGTYNLEDKTQF